MEIIIISSIITGLIVSVLSFVITMMLRRSWDQKDSKNKEILDIKSEIEWMQKCIWRLNKTTLIFGKILDEQTRRIHPDLSPNLEDIATELLRGRGEQQDF